MLVSGQTKPIRWSRAFTFYCFIFSFTFNLFKMVVSGGVDYCYSDIGCFPLSAEFYHPQHRPVNVRPWHRRHIRTQFELFNRDHPEGYMLVPWDKFNLIHSGFNPRLETKVIIPGWLDNINRAIWVRKLKDALLYLWTPVNIIVVRWRNFTPYTIATANTRVVGAELANLMRYLEHEINYDRAYYHIIGHSLGAHIAGYCGDRIHGLGRITALDPARPFFQGMPKSVRLDRGDAKFVDVIHSDFTPENAIFLLMSYGMTTPVGHLDFYPNGPPLFQPGCMRDTLLAVQTGIAKGLQENSLSVAFLESTRYLTACDHQRSHEWFIESITNRECVFVGVRCNEFEGMINGRCTCDDSPSACAIMGIHADQMYLHGVHEELWPVRAGSIEYKYKTSPAPPPFRHLFASQQYPTTSQPQLPPMHHVEPFTSAHHNDADDNDDESIELDELGHNDMHTMYDYTQPDDGGELVLPAQVALYDALVPPLHSQIMTNPSLALQYSLVGHHLLTPTTREQVYAQLKHSARQMQKPDEPSIEHQEAAFNGGDYAENATTTTTTTTSTTSTTTTTTSTPASVYDEFNQQQTYHDHEAAASEQSELFGDSVAATSEQYDALNDVAFLNYLRMSLLSNQQANTTSERQHVHRDVDKHDDVDDDDNGTYKRRRNDDTDQPVRYNGHPHLMSAVHRDIETWYEDNSRWFLKTNNQPKYCSNQYQLLIYLGPLKTTNGRDRLRANLLVSIVGTRGQLLNQRFVPRGATLNSFTMQPFFILLEGSYSLGQIKSVAISWQQRHEPDPVQATVTFKSNALEEVGSRVPAYKAKQAPWIPETMKYDKTSGFQFAHPMMRVHSKRHHRRLMPTVGSIRTTIGGHYSNSYNERMDSNRFALNRLRAQASDKFGRRLSRSSSASADECASSGDRLKLVHSHNKNCHATAKHKISKRSEYDSIFNLLEASANSDQEQTNHNQLEELTNSTSAISDQFEQNNNNNPFQAEKNQEKSETHLTRDVVAPSSSRVSIPRPGLDLVNEESTSEDTFFVPLVDPVREKQRIRPHTMPKAVDKYELEHENGKVTLDLHNIDLHAEQYASENSIVINKIVVSPLQANYGKLGHNAKSFCPAIGQRKLRQDRTVRLTPAPLGHSCFELHQPIPII